MAKGISHREWEIERSDYDTDEEFRRAVRRELSLAEHIGERLGVAVVAAPKRTRSPFGGWITHGWIFQTASIPSGRHVEPDDLPELAETESALVEDADPLAHVE